MNLLSYGGLLVLFFVYVCQQFYKFFLGFLGEFLDFIGEEEGSLMHASVYVVASRQQK